MDQKRNSCDPRFVLKQMIRTMTTNPMSKLSRCWPLKTTGAPLTRPCNLAKATTEPVKVMAPMTEPKLISMRLDVLMFPTVPMP